MKKKLLLTIVTAFALSTGYAQKDRFWSAHKGTTDKITKDKGVNRISFPTEFDLYDLNIGSLRQELFSKTNNPSQSVIVSIPNVNGQLEQFEIYEASNFEADLQAQFPEIRAYSGKGITDKFATLKLSISPQGIQTMVFRTGKENEFIEPYSQDHTVYAVFKSNRQAGKLGWTCSTEDQNMVNGLTSQVQNVTGKSSTGQLKTMRLAQSVTAEYSNYFGATSSAQVALVLAAINNTLTRCNGVYERELGLHLNMVAQSTNVIYYNAATDPYSPAATGASGAWNTELQNTLSSSLTGPSTSLAANNAAYDIGHLFGASGGGGNAGCIGCVCVDDTAAPNDKKKGSGFTSPADGIPQGDNFDIDYVVHEVGHQLGANHTFSNNNEGSGVNMEVGSGVTIMGYAGITSEDVAPHSIDVYHAASISQIQTNLAGKTCPVTTNIAANNATPVANAGADYTIPKSTPFMLIGSATDANAGDALTYSWEQYDNDDAMQTGAASAASATKTTGPNWRSFSPTTSPIRYFPQMSSILSGSTTTNGSEIVVEALSSVARTLNFRLTVRDNAPYSATAPVKVGQTNFDNMVVTIDAARGPLTVTSQNTDGIVWAPGSTQNITWTVNNTNTSTGGANVDILLSTDNGATFSTVLLANTPNDGAQTITVPSITAANCRIMVKASGSIFFNVNTKNIAIGNYTYQSQNICNDYTFNLNSAITESTGTSYPGISVNITDSFTITDANFYANVTHPNIGQFNLLLMAPWQVSLNTALWYNNTGCTGANMNKWFDTTGTAVNCANVNDNTFSNAFAPYSSANISGYNGNNSAGAWKLYFKDTVVDGNNTGATLNTFTIQLCYSQMVPVLGNESFGLENFTIYPNPNNGNFTVQFDSNSGNNVKVGVHDLRGRLIFENEYQNTGTFNQNIQLKNVQSGIYIVTVQDGERKETKKISIN